MLGTKPAFLVSAAALVWALAGPAIAADPEPVAKGDSRPLAKLFGERERAHDIEMSPDGKHVVFVAPGPGIITYAAIEDVDTLETHAAARDDGKPLLISSCGWSSNTRIVCREYGVAFDHDPPIPFTRTVSVDSDGKNGVYIGRRVGPGATRVNQFDGQIIDWGAGDGNILMTRDYIPTDDLGTAVNHDEDGLGSIALTQEPGAEPPSSIPTRALPIISRTGRAMSASAR